jgi:hypothetical protein
MAHNKVLCYGTQCVKDQQKEGLCKSSSFGTELGVQGEITCPKLEVYVPLPKV